MKKLPAASPASRQDVTPIDPEDGLHKTFEDPEKSEALFRAVMRHLDAQSPAPPVERRPRKER